MEKDKLLYLIKALCYYEGKFFIIPHFHGKEQNSCFTEDELEEALEKFIDNYNLKNFTKGMLKNILSEVFYDGKGFLVPVFRTYVNKRIENQTPNDFKDGIPFYNFEKDTSFEAFILDLWNNLDDVDSWIKNRKSKLGSHLVEAVYSSDLYKFAETCKKN